MDMRARTKGKPTVLVIEVLYVKEILFCGGDWCFWLNLIPQLLKLRWDLKAEVLPSVAKGVSRFIV